MKKSFIISNIVLFSLWFFITSETGGNLIGNDFVDRIYHPFVWFLLLIPLSIFALSLNEEKHKFWLKFTGVFFIISMVLVYMMPEYGAGMLSPDRELTNWFFAGLYTFISIIYFIVQFVKSRKNRIG